MIPAAVSVIPAAVGSRRTAGDDSLGNVSRVDVLPFHKLGEPKWQGLGKPFPLRDTPTPTLEQPATARNIFTAHGPTTV
ncbi:hypothetical protein [Streptomyces sp. NPDC055134]